jgi:hypothetical protein
MLINPFNGENNVSVPDASEQVDGATIGRCQISRSILISTELPTESKTPQPITSLNELQRQNGSISKTLSASHLTSQANGLEHVGNHADPLSPLKQRDLVALHGLFYRSDVQDIEADITQILLRLFPEPSWDEDPFEFLREFL